MAASLVAYYGRSTAEPRLVDHYAAAGRTTHTVVPQVGPSGTPRMVAKQTNGFPPPASLTAPMPALGITNAQRDSAASWLLFANACCTFATNISMGTSNQLWLEHFAGDFAAHGAYMTRLSAISSVLGFFVKPLIASLSDVYGRKPLLYFSPTMQMLLKGGVGFVPKAFIVPMLSSQYLLGAFTYESMHLATDAAMGDLYSTNPKLLGKQLARQMVIWPLSSMVCPLIGGWLAARSIRLPFMVTGALFFITTFLAMPRVPETLQPSGE